jgi:hypothetical protein
VTTNPIPAGLTGLRLGYGVTTSLVPLKIPGHVEFQNDRRYLLVWGSLHGPQPLGPQGSDSNGGIIDSTAKYDNTSARLKDSAGVGRDSTMGRDTTGKPKTPLN